MARYIVNKNAQTTGEHEVHNLNACNRLPDPANRIDLGEHYSCQSAVLAAKIIYSGSKVDGCYYCSPSCHTR